MTFIMPVLVGILSTITGLVPGRIPFPSDGVTEKSQKIMYLKISTKIKYNFSIFVLINNQINIVSLPENIS
jgi:hypothetical protein